VLMTFCPMKIKSWGFTVFSWTILGHMTWAFICSLSEAQKGADDRGQIKALAGWLAETAATRASVLAMLTALHSKLLFPPTRAIAACSTCAACRACPMGAAHTWNCKQLSLLCSARHNTIVQHLQLALHPLHPVKLCPTPLGPGTSGPWNFGPPSGAIQKAHLWLPATTTAMDVVVSASGPQHKAAGAALRAAKDRSP